MIRALLCSLLAVILSPLSIADEKPNFVIIFIDDMGYGDIEPFGSTINQTPNLNRMAAEGMKLTSFYAAPVCSASRAQLLTGSYAPRVSVPGVFFPIGPKGLNPEEHTIADYLKEQGYATACVGKWHLGDQKEFLPTRHGFDSYFGIPFSNDMQRTSTEHGKRVTPVLRDETVERLIEDEAQRLITRQYTEEAVEFIAAKAQADEPFFLYLPHSAIHTPIFPHPDFAGQSENGRLGDWIAEVELFDEAVRFARVQFDHFDMDVVSIMPPDGYSAICQCDLCESKESPELGPRGHLSNHVWDFVNRVAKEIAISHPGKRISNCAYGVYTEPPGNIDKLEPNVQVIIVGGRRPKDPDPENIRRIREAWTKKTDNPIEIFENYPFTARNFYLPVFNPTVLGEGINATKGISRGEDVWLSQDYSEKGGGLNHFMVYFTARMYWGGKDQDIGVLLDEYLERFYGPAAEPMGAFFAYCEEHWMTMDQDAATAGRALELFELAKQQADPESIYGRRLAMVGNFLERLRLRLTVLSQKRGRVPSVRKVGGDPVTPIVVDGKLDDLPWQKIATSSTGKFREIETGEPPEYGTTFMVQWRNHRLYFAIRCEEKPGEPFRIATEKNEDPALWYGDNIEILLETDRNSYYQIAVNPSGAIIDMDRSADQAGRQRWASQAEVATHVADDHWIVEIGIPVTTDENDPYHQVIGTQPSVDLPWHINLCRQRVRDGGTELSAFAPTGTKSFHVPMKFGHFHKGGSHRFEADPSVTDYLIESDKAKKLIQAKKREEGLAIYLALADDEKSTPRQESLALERAVTCARALKDRELEKELRERLEAIGR